jgi:hypothetical protein
MPDAENNSKFELECLRLASDFRQLARETRDPELKAQCLRMAEQWSAEAHGLAKDDSDKDSGQ